MIARGCGVITQNTEVLGNTSQYLPLAGCGAVVLRNAALCSAASRPLRLPASRTATPSRTLAPHVGFTTNRCLIISYKATACCYLIQDYV